MTRGHATAAPQNDLEPEAGEEHLLGHSRERLAVRHLVVIGSLVLLGPNFVFASALGLWPAIVVLAGSMGYAILAWSTPVAASSVLSEPVAVGRLGTCALVALALLVLGGEAHLFYTNWDWLWRDAVLADLTRGSSLPTYNVSGNLYVLRAPLGMYLLPALLGKGLGLAAAHVALLAQNTLILTLVLYLVATMAGARAWFVVFVFVSFSGLDIVGEIVLHPKSGDPGSLPSHLEWWAGAFQYSSVVTQLFWCPNHALPAYWLTVLVLLRARREIDMASLGIATAASLMWSPFAVIGILPFAVYLVLRDLRAIIAARRSWWAAAVALAFCPVALYLKADAAQVPHAFLLFVPGVALLIAVFLVVEIPHAAVVAVAWRQLDPALRGLFGVAISVLIVLPTVRLGLANDLVMRASIPALTILAVAFADAMADAWPSRPVLLVVGAVLMLLGAVTPVQELTRSLSFPSFEISDCNLVTVWKKIGRKQPTLENYLAKNAAMPPWLLGSQHVAPLLSREDQTCWPDLRLDPALPLYRLSNTELKRSSSDYKPY